MTLITTKTSFNFDRVGPDVEKRNDLNTPIRTFRNGDLVPHRDSQITVERHVPTAGSGHQLGELGWSSGVESLQVLDNVVDVHANLLLVHVQGTELLADLAVDLSKTPVGAVGLALDLVLGWWARPTILDQRQLPAKLAVLDVGLEGTLAINASAWAQRCHARTVNEQRLFRALERIAVDEVADLCSRIRRYIAFCRVDLPPGSSMKRKGL